MTDKRSRLLEVRQGGETRILSRVPLTDTSDGIRYDEAYIEKLLFENPQALPIEEIDATYVDPVPVCTQLTTQAGILDALFITRSGRIVIVEAKLWRNPEAKRKVIAQILDYASELARWTYDDLEREVARRLGMGRISLFDKICSDDHELDEAQFVDEITRSLRLGRFLLLVCGDGIREGLGSIADFLEGHTTLDFTFGLIEMAIYDGGDGRHVIDPRVLARSVTLRRQVLRVEAGVATIEDDLDDDLPETQEPSEREKMLLDFWTNLANRIEFDDPTQLPPNPSTRGHVTLRMPSTRSWITLYFEKSSGEQGLFLTFNRGEVGDIFYQRLCDEREEIEKELPNSAIWRSEDGKHSIIIKRQAPDLTEQAGRHDAFQWFQEAANQFVNAFRPRISRYQDEV